ncbi:PH domain-containing protein [Fulvivirga sp.]|uniref:PH domain-containing protein n=1 Tax=Fulvivirga sp. TaxID=1931237 RepID=UPI0032EDBBBD
MKFESKKDILFNSVMLGTLGLLIWIMAMVLTNGLSGETKYITLFFTLCLTGLVLWVYFGTSYSITQHTLSYRSGPIRGKIEIEKIKEIIKGKTLWVGLKPATSTNGLIIKYGKYDEIYISPKTNELFIQKLLELKSDIKVTE